MQTVQRLWSNLKGFILFRYVFSAPHHISTPIFAHFPVWVFQWYSSENFSPSCFNHLFQNVHHYHHHHLFQPASCMVHFASFFFVVVDSSLFSLLLRHFSMLFTPFNVFFPVLNHSFIF